jgi:hypothetical protein
MSKYIFRAAHVLAATMSMYAATVVAIATCHEGVFFSLAFYAPMFTSIVSVPWLPLLFLYLRSADIGVSVARQNFLAVVSLLYAFCYAAILQDYLSGEQFEPSTCQLDWETLLVPPKLLFLLAGLLATWALLVHVPYLLYLALLWTILDAVGFFR